MENANFLAKNRRKKLSVRQAEIWLIYSKTKKMKLISETQT